MGGRKKIENSKINKRPHDVDLQIRIQTIINIYPIRIDTNFYGIFLSRNWGIPFLYTSQKMKLSIKDFFNFLRIRSHLVTKSLMENFIFCAVIVISPEP